MKLDAFCTKMKIGNEEQTFFMMFLPKDQPPTVKDKVQTIVLRQVNLQNVPSAKELHAIVLEGRLVCMSDKGKIQLQINWVENLAHKVIVDTGAAKAELPKNSPIVALTPPLYSAVADLCEQSIKKKFAHSTAAAS